MHWFLFFQEGSTESIYEPAYSHTLKEVLPKCQCSPAFRRRRPEWGGSDPSINSVIIFVFYSDLYLMMHVDNFHSNIQNQFETAEFGYSDTPQITYWLRTECLCDASLLCTTTGQPLKTRERAWERRRSGADQACSLSPINSVRQELNLFPYCVLLDPAQLMQVHAKLCNSVFKRESRLRVYSHRWWFCAALLRPRRSLN